METLHKITITLNKINVESNGMGSDWQFGFELDEQTSSFSRRILSGKSTSPKLSVYSDIVSGGEDVPLSLPLTIDITEKDPKFDDKAALLSSLDFPLVVGSYKQVVTANVEATGGDAGAQASLMFEFSAEIEPVDSGQFITDDQEGGNNTFEIGDKTNEVKTPTIFTQEFKKTATCPKISVKWSSGLPIISKRFVPIPINAENHNRKAKLSIVTDPNSKVSLAVQPPAAGKLSKTTINGKGEVIFTANKNTSAFAIIMTINKKMCAAVFGQNFKFTPTVVPQGGTVDDKGPFTAEGQKDVISLKGFLGNNTKLKKDTATRKIIGRIDVDTAPKNFYLGNITADVSLTAGARVSLFTNGFLGFSFTILGKTFTIAALSSTAEFAGSVKLTGVTGSTPVAFAGFKANAPDLSLANPGKAIGDTGGTPADQEAKTSTGSGSPASFPANQNSKVGYELTGTISGEKSRVEVAGTGTIVESTSQANATVRISKTDISAYKIVLKLPAFTKP